MTVCVFDFAEEIPELKTTSWKEDPRLEIKAPEDGRLRKNQWGVRQIILHTTKGIPGGKDKRPQQLRMGMGPFTDAGVRGAAYCRIHYKDRANSGGYHLTVDADGSVSQHMDLGKFVAYHAHTANEFSIGVEIFQGLQAELYQAQMDAVVKLCDWLTRKFQIQRQFHLPYMGPIPRFDASHRGGNCVGIFGHRDVTNKRGPGDPGEFPFFALRSAGYEQWDFNDGEDLRIWANRQAALNLPKKSRDGVPGPETCRALVAAGYLNGLWTKRPSD